MSAEGDDWGTSGGVGSGGEEGRRSGRDGPNERMGQQGKGAMGQGQRRTTNPKEGG